MADYSGFSSWFLLRGGCPGCGAKAPWGRGGRRPLREPCLSLCSRFSAKIQLHQGRWRDGGVGNVQSAFRLLEPGPASGAGIFAGTNRARAVRAADAGEVLIVQRVVGHIVLVQIVPNVFGGPICDWVNFYKLKFLVPLNFVGAGAGRGLIAPDRRNPCAQAG